MIGELRFILEGNNEPAQVVTCDSTDILLLGAQELGQVAHAGRDPADGLRAFSLGSGIGSVGYQCILKRHYFFLTLIV